MKPETQTNEKTFFNKLKELLEFAKKPIRTEEQRKQLTTLIIRAAEIIGFGTATVGILLGAIASQMPQENIAVLEQLSTQIREIGVAIIQPSVLVDFIRLFMNEKKQYKGLLKQDKEINKE